jgi:subtilisin family serine protease
LGKITLFSFKTPITTDEVEALIRTLSGDPAVDYVPLTFTSGSTEMIVTDEFIAQFDPSLSEEDIRSLTLQSRVEIIKRMDGVNNTYVLRTVGENALQKANDFHRMDRVIYSHPNFLRIYHDPARIDPNETVIWGPKGERYFGDKEALKGTDLYRGMGPAKMFVSQTSLQASSSAVIPFSDVSRSQIKQETFEGAFPNAWSLYGNPSWGRTAYRKYAGSYSGYCVGSSVTAPGPYPNNANSWMIFGPFSLAGVTDARVNLQAWIRTESGYDKFAVYASTDRAWFYGYEWWGDWATHSGGTGWMNIGFDLKRVFGLGDLRGQPQVWIAIRFLSDSSVTFEGAYIDNIVIEKITGGLTSITSDVYDDLQWSLKNTQQLWGVSGADIKAVDAWAISQGSSNTVIAIIDEGVDLSHPDLASKLVPGYDATGYGSNGGPSGNDAHGTNCAGIAAAITNNSQGVAGIARLAKIMPVRIAKDDGSGGWLTSDSWIADGINWAVNHGADVLSNSWGGGTPATVLTNAIKNAKTNGRNGKGSVVVFAAGNANGPVSYPATLSEVIAVGALSPCDERKAPTSCDGEWWWGSNYGNELDITAPGVHMYSTDIQGSAGYSTDDYFYDFNGTSSACPVVAGVAGLLLGKCPNMKATAVERILKRTADDLGTSGWDQYFGYGRVNAHKALMSDCRANAIPGTNFLLLQ